MDSGASSGDVVLKLRVQRKGGGIIYGETGLKFSVIASISETFDWVCCNINEEGGGVSEFR